MLVISGLLSFFVSADRATGAVGNASVTIHFGENPVEHFSSATLLGEYNGTEQATVKLPGYTQSYVLTRACGFLPGWLATVDSNTVVVESPDGLKYVYPESSNHMLKWIENADDANVVTFDYNDANGNLIDTQSDGFDPNLYIEYKYDASGLLEEIIAHDNDANVSRTYTITYDDANEVIAVSGSCAACGGFGSFRYEYDSNGVLKRLRDANDPNTVIYEYAYDPNNIRRLTFIYLGEANDANHIRRLEYVDGSGGNYVLDTYDYTDANNYRVTREYRDSAGIVTKRIKYEDPNEDPNDPAGESFTEHTVYIRDANNNLTRKVTIPPLANASDPPDPNSGIRKEYTYDPNAGRVLTEKWFDANDVNITVSEYTYDYIYDPCGNILNTRINTHTDARGATTYYYYDGNDVDPNLKLMPQVTEGISGTQQLKYEYEYDSRKRVTIETQLDNSNNVLAQTRYVYDDWGNLLERLDYNDVGNVNDVTEYRYNGFNEMTRMILASGVVSGKSYNDNGKLESEFVLANPDDVNESEPNLVSQTKYYYDGNGRVKEIAKAVDDGVFDFNSPDSWVWTEYEYDLRGNRTKVIEDAEGLKLKTLKG
jgi:YD repeat-containing protein